MNRYQYNLTQWSAWPLPRTVLPHRRHIHRRRLREPACLVVEDDLRGRVEYGPVGAGS